VTFTPKAERQNCCCEKHGALHCMRERRRTGKEPREPWGDARRERYQRRRALKKAAATGEVVVFSAVADRDGWVCGLCDVAVDPDLQWPDPFSGSLDHVVPLSRGGAHDPGNVQLAHLRCNTVKGNRIEVLA
jgi:5-methylcytosine-specific restriction endonuclease McrA